ncbi:serine serine/threonine-protein kinase Nek5 isoform X1 [Solea senegalensis]|uniref:non-specific serine/threonine protein kinase n=1 Tax=Solea senegalensis TaxID=28829 RepID=A0AAV6RCX2_SOLSE|nr:serine serine/threonine-protein kinase Nek5 isoform X1 [Solea senegalensis]
MVKVSFNSALGQKDVKKDAETLLPDEERDAEAAMVPVLVPVAQQTRAWCWCMCLGLALMLSGVVVGGAYLYRYYILEEGQVFVCGVSYREEDYMIQEEEVDVELPSPYHLHQLEERIRVLEREQVELISVPVPEFEDGDPADIVHDFQRMLTAYLDLNLNKCYVIPLNTSIVLPPKNFLELLVNVKAGAYLPQSYLVHEDMVVTERLHHVDQLGYFIYNLCRGKDTFKLQRRDRILGMQKREAVNCPEKRAWAIEPHLPACTAAPLVARRGTNVCSRQFSDAQGHVTGVMNNYEVMGQIGEGAFGKVFLVREKGRDRQSVVKQIDLRKMSVKDRQSSHKEVSLLSKMKHPNIVSFITSFQESGSLFIVMEFCDGGDLMKRINMQGGLFLAPLGNLELFRSVLGLKHIHDRDSAQEHPKLSGGIKAKLGDFGIARMLNNTMEMARTCVGTPCYTSPNSYQQSCLYKMDIWSLGCVLYELCTLKHPFEGSSLRQVVSKICRGRYNPVPSCYSSELRLLITQLFKVNPRQRPSVSSVLKRPFLETLSKHLHPQEDQSPKLQRNRITANPPEMIHRSRGGGAVKRQSAKPVWRAPSTINGPAHHRPLHLRAADREVRGQHNHRGQYQHYHAQLDALHLHHHHRRPRPQEEVERREDQAPPPPVEPYQLVAAARHEYLQRKYEAKEYKLRAEKQLGLRPCTAESHRPGGQELDKGRPEDRRQEGQQEYLRQLDVIRHQYHQEMRHRRLRAETEPEHKHEAFVGQSQRRVFNRGGAAAATESPLVDIHYIFTCAGRGALQLIRENKHKKGIMFEIRLEDHKTRDRGGEELKLRDWSEERKGWSQRTPQLDALQRQLHLRHSGGDEQGAVFTKHILLKLDWNLSLTETDWKQLDLTETVLKTVSPTETVNLKLDWKHLLKKSDSASVSLSVRLRPDVLTADCSVSSVPDPHPEEDCDMETAEESPELKSDDEDTNFEDSDDELRDAVADSMKNLFIMDEDTRETAEVHDGKWEDGGGDTSAVEIQQVQPQLKSPREDDQGQSEDTPNVSGHDL